MFSAGPIWEALRPSVERHVHTIVNRLRSESCRATEWEELNCAESWIATLCRLLLRIQGLGHGGALLIAPNRSFEDLNVKYKIRYERLRTALEWQNYYYTLRSHATQEILGICSNRKAKDIPVDLYSDETVNARHYRGCLNELDGAIGFVAVLTMVDGLVLLSPGLDVQGFGAEITCTEQLPDIYLSETPRATPSALHRIDYAHFGTRHRSMMRYCYRKRGSVGFVISQDGDVRALTRVGANLIMWENIKLQRDYSATGQPATASSSLQAARRSKMRLKQ